MSEDCCWTPSQVGPPDGMDPGQWAMESYREWRTRIYGCESAPKIPESEDLLPPMKEELPS